MTKFKVGDVLKVVRRNDTYNNEGDEGSEERKDFIVASITRVESSNPIYWPTDNERGAYEYQLEYQNFPSWKEVLEKWHK